MVSEVHLRLYDISRGMANMFSSSLLGFRIEAIWHSGVFVYGNEYFFGGGGINFMPGNQFQIVHQLQPLRTINMGNSNKTEQELISFLQNNQSRFTDATYNLINWNCNNFSNEVTKFLLNVEIPSYVLHLPKTVLSSAAGGMLSGLLNQFYEGNTSGTHIPFSNNSSPLAASTPPPSPPSPTELVIPKHLTPLYESLVYLCSSNPPSLNRRRTLEILSTILTNLIRYPGVPKYRTIKSSNKAVQEKLLSHGGGKECLCALGFTEINEEKNGGMLTKYVFDDEGGTKDMQQLQDAVHFIAECMNRIDEESGELRIKTTDTAQVVSTMNNDNNKYAEQLQLLEEMGFASGDDNLRILMECNGSVEVAVEKLDKLNNP